MRRLLYVLPFITLLLFTISCAKHHNTQTTDLGNLPVELNLTPAIQHGFNVTRVNVRITMGDFTDDMDLAIDSTAATGTFTDLEIGTYAIDVSVYQDSLLVATGHGTGTVTPGETSTVYITLQFVPGGLQIIIHWGLPYEESRRVLFVGNSHTYYNGGVDVHLDSLLTHVHPEWGAVIQAHTIGGATLQDLFNDPATLSTISTGDWDLVILQEQSSRPMNYPDLFYQYSTALDSVIAASGALTGFYMTWSWRHNPEMYVPIRDAYNYIGAYLDALVAPAGIAWHNNYQNADSLDLYAPDNYHPSLNGTYLVSCIFLATIWNLNPVGNTYIPAGIDSTSAAYLQNLAWTTVQNYYNAGKERRLDIMSREPMEKPRPPQDYELLPAL
jgi:hypothetical protein